VAEDKVGVGGAAEKPGFVAGDVCEALGISSRHAALDRLDDDEKGAGTTDAPGGTQTVALHSEGGAIAPARR
jgi:prophage antirepressor-like protein